MMKCNDEYRYPSLAYICCGIDSKVAVVDLEETRHIGDILCGADTYPYYIAITKNGKTAYVADYTGKRVLMLDLEQNRLVSQVDVIGFPVSLDISPTNHCVYVVFADVPFMQVFEADLTCSGQIALLSYSDSVSVVNCGRQICVTQPELNQTIVIEACTGFITQYLNTGINPGRTAYSAKEGLLLVAGRVSRTLTVVDIEHGYVCTDIALTGTPSGLAFTRNNRECLVALQDMNVVEVVDLCSSVAITQIPVGELPGSVAASKYQDVAVVTNQVSSTVQIIDTQYLAVTNTLVVGNNPVGAAINC